MSHHPLPPLQPVPLCVGVCAVCVDDRERFSVALRFPHEVCIRVFFERLSDVLGVFFFSQGMQLRFVDIHQ